MKEVNLRFSGVSKQLLLIFGVLFLSSVLLVIFNFWISIDVTQTMYLTKAGIDWWNDIVLLKGDLLILCFLLPLLVIDPRITHCKILGLIRTFSWTVSWRRIDFQREASGNKFDDKYSLKMGLAYQITLYCIFFVIVWLTQAFDLALPFHMAKNGIGSLNFQSLVRIFLFPVFNPTAGELMTLTPIMETWYLITITVATIPLVIWMARLILGGIGELIVGGVGRALRNFSATISLFFALFLLQAPFFEFDVTSPHFWCILVALDVLSIAATVIFHLHREKLVFNRKLIVTYSAVLGVIFLVFVANLGFILIYRLQWDRSWLQYEWFPKTSKEIEYTKWSSGVSEWQHQLLSDINSSNDTSILLQIRQWDFDASLTKMKSQIGVNWLTLADSDVLYLNNREYWVCPTTINYDIAVDWISRRFIYTNTPRVIVIDSHTGDFVQPEAIFNLSKIPRIYYGEGFDDVYVQVEGFTEIDDVTYQEEPDYVLRGWVRAWWFLKEGQFGFALNPPKEDIAMLWSRDVNKRVKTILLNHLTIDDDVYLVTDNNRLYYCAQVFINYPLVSGFAKSSYMRFLGVVTVDVENGELRGYSVSESDGFLLDFYKLFYGWPQIPDWLRSQIRVPETLYEYQLDIDYRYHVDDPTIWRSRSDEFERPAGTDVYYILVTIEDKMVFVAVQVVEYSRATGLNLAGLYTALCGTEYGEAFFYRVPLEQRLIGPSAARQAFETNTDVRTRLSLLQTYRFGNVLLYNIQDELYYFIPVYSEVTTGDAVIVKLSFIGCIEASTGEKVATGLDALSAYNALTPSPIVGEEERLLKMDTLFLTDAIDIEEATLVRGDVEHLITVLTYNDESQWETAQQAIIDYINNYCKPNSVDRVFKWITIVNNEKYIHYGFIVIDPQGLRTLYYMQIRIST